MHRVTIEMDDKEYDYFINVYAKEHDIKIFNDVEISKQIKSGDRSGFKETTPEQFFKDLGI